MKLHTLPIKMTKHAAIRLINKFDMSIEELRHVLKPENLLNAQRKMETLVSSKGKSGKGTLKKFSRSMMILSGL